MNALKQARRLIASQPQSPAARTLAGLVLTLESEGSFDLASLYQLDLANFNLALEILRDWRLDRYYAGKAKLFDISWQLRADDPV